MTTLNNFSLVDTPDALDFMHSANTPSGRTARLGNQETHKGDHFAFNAVGAAQVALREGCEKITKLTADVTRNDIQKHDAAKKIAERTAAVIEGSRKTLERLSQAYEDNGAKELEEQFVLDEKRSFIHGKMAEWISQQAGIEGGYANIREAILTNSEFASVIYRWPHQLLGLPAKQRTEFMAKITSHWSPKAERMFIYSQDLKALASRYPKTIEAVKAFFYNGAIAAQMKHRVEV